MYSYVTFTNRFLFYPCKLLWVKSDFKNLQLNLFIYIETTIRTYCYVFVITVISIPNSVECRFIKCGVTLMHILV